MTRGQSAMIFQFGWLNRVRAERGAEGTPLPLRTCPFPRRQSGPWARREPGSAGRPPCRGRKLQASWAGTEHAPEGLPGQAGGWGSLRSLVSLCGAGERRRGPQEMRGRVRREKQTKITKNIYGGNELFFSLNQVQCIREFSYLCMLRDC